MAKYRQLHTDFWNDGFVLDLTPEEKYFYIYLMTNPNTAQCGIYELPKRIIETQTGYNRETIDKLLKRFIEYEKINYCEETKEILMINWIKYNQPNNSNAIKCVNKELKNIKNGEFVFIFYKHCVNHGLDVETIFKEIDTSAFEGAYEGLISKEVISNKEETINNKKEIRSKKEEIISAAAFHEEDVLQFFEKNIYKPKELERKKIKGWIKNISCEVIILAVEEAVQYNAKNIKYIESILDNWREKGLTTIDEVMNYKKQWDKTSFKDNKKESSAWNFKGQREYDFDGLKKKLLGWDTN